MIFGLLPCNLLAQYGPLSPPIPPYPEYTGYEAHRHQRPFKLPIANIVSWLPNPLLSRITAHKMYYTKLYFTILCIVMHFSSLYCTVISVQCHFTDSYMSEMKAILLDLLPNDAGLSTNLNLTYGQGHSGHTIGGNYVCM